jgi:hypothetical protein
MGCIKIISLLLQDGRYSGHFIDSNCLKSSEGNFVCGHQEDSLDQNACKSLYIIVLLPNQEDAFFCPTPQYAIGLAN